MGLRTTRAPMKSDRTLGHLVASQSTHYGQHFGTATADSSPSEFSLRVFVRCLHRRRKLTSADFSDKESLKVEQLKRTRTKRMMGKRPAPGSKDGDRKSTRLNSS